jgi:hypothetical protein
MTAISACAVLMRRTDGRRSCDARTSELQGHTIGKSWWGMVNLNLQVNHKGQLADNYFFCFRKKFPRLRSRREKHLETT